MDETPKHLNDAEFLKEIEVLGTHFWLSLGQLPERSTALGRAAVAKLLGLACQAQGSRNIEVGRYGLTRLPRMWLLDRVEEIALQELDLNDEWEYRRLLEVYTLLDRLMAERLVELGLTSQNPEVVEAAQDFSGTCREPVLYIPAWGDRPPW